MGKPISIDTRLFNFKWIDIRWSKLIGMEGMAMIIYYTIKSNIKKKNITGIKYFKHEKVNQQVCLSANSTTDWFKMICQ